MVYEHEYDEEIQEEKNKNAKELSFLLDYEVKSSWWAGYIFIESLQNIVARYFTRKTIRKWKRYKIFKIKKNAETNNSQF